MWRILFSVFFIIVFSIEATLTPKSRKNLKTSKSYKAGPQNRSVFDRNLVSAKTSPKDILDNNKAYFREVDNYNFEGQVLGYITPVIIIIMVIGKTFFSFQWNNHGYEIGKIFGNKFTQISPVWLELKRTNDQSYELSGTHDVDKAWMIHVRNAGRERHLKSNLTS